MLTKRNKKITDLLLLIFGAAVYSAGINSFLIPSGISAGGFTGIGTLLEYTVNIPTGLTVALLNIPLIFVSYKKLGGGFVVKTAVSVFLLSVSLEIFSFFPKVYTDKILSGIFGGLCTGTGISMFLIKGATTGGTDIIAKLINRRYPQISVGRVILIFDAVVILLTAFVYKDVTTALYSVISIYVSTTLIDTLLYGSDKGKAVFVVSDKSEEIISAVTKGLGRGITVINSYGGYTGKAKKLLLSVVRLNEITALNKIILTEDKNAFIIVIDSKEILGNGFK